MITINNLTKRYNGNIVFNDFNYEINDNLFLIIGSNGIGKTTLLNCITNYISYEGQIEGNTKISYLPEVRDFDDDVVVKDLLDLFSGFYGSNVDEYLDEFDYNDNLKKEIDSLSKGNKTKLFMFCALLKPADIYVFDEPTDGMDIKSKETFVRLMLKLSEEKMMIVSTHDFGIIEQLKSKAKVLNLDEEKCLKR